MLSTILKNIDIDYGITKSISSTVLDSSTNLPVDISSYTAVLKATSCSTDQQVFTLSSASGNISLNTTGVVSIIFPPSFSTFNAGGPTRLYYDVMITNPGNVKYKVLYGFICINYCTINS